MIKGDGAMLLMWDEIHQQPAVLKNCIDKNLGAIIRIAETVKARNFEHVLIAARGTSDHACHL